MESQSTIARDAVDDILARWATEHPDLDASPLQVLGRLHRCYVFYSSSLADLLDMHGLNVASFDLLAALRRAGAPYRMTSSQLAELSLVSTSGITLRVDRLVKAGLVERDRDPNDRRVVHAQLTLKGLETIDHIIGPHFQNESAMLAGLSAGERETLSNLLRKLESSIISGTTGTVKP
ncbi:Transcriptional regulator SlyA (plasmid) [Rhodococcus ruber]|uniref:MarR family winged helix-turn-helix transcriptional regulator n=1 Tax=Rhodococcus ruber TaxID=1830 RepID=UPI00315CA053